MVDVKSSGEFTRLVLTPNRSLSWRLNKCLIAFACLWSGLIGLGLTLAGAWPVLPFVGLELGGLASGIWYTCWKLRIQEVIYISDRSVRLERGIRGPETRLAWEKDRLKARVFLHAHPDQAPIIEFSDGRGQSVRIGAFLNLADCQALIHRLRCAGLPLRASEGEITRRF